MVALFLVVSLPIAFSRVYYVDIYTGQSIMQFRTQDKAEALGICSLYVEKAQVISFYSYESQPYNQLNPYSYVPKIPQLAPEVMEDTSVAPYRIPLYCLMPKRREEDLSANLYPVFRRYRKGQYRC